MFDILLDFITDTLDRTIGEKRHQVTVELRIKPWEGEMPAIAPVIEYAESISDLLHPDLREAIENGISTSYLQGKRVISAHVLKVLYLNCLKKLRFCCC